MCASSKTMHPSNSPRGFCLMSPSGKSPLPTLSHHAMSCSSRERSAFFPGFCASSARTREELDAAILLADEVVVDVLLAHHAQLHLAERPAHRREVAARVVLEVGAHAHPHVVLGPPLREQQRVEHRAGDLPPLADAGAVADEEAGRAAVGEPLAVASRRVRDGLELQRAEVLVLHEAVVEVDEGSGVVVDDVALLELGRRHVRERHRLDHRRRVRLAHLELRRRVRLEHLDLVVLHLHLAAAAAASAAIAAAGLGRRRRAAAAAGAAAACEARRRRPRRRRSSGDGGSGGARASRRRRRRRRMERRCSGEASAGRRGSAAASAGFIGSWWTAWLSGCPSSVRVFVEWLRLVLVVGLRHLLVGLGCAGAAASGTLRDAASNCCARSCDARGTAGRAAPLELRL